MKFYYTVTVTYGENGKSITDVKAKNANHAMAILSHQPRKGGIEIKSISAEISEDSGDSSTVDSVLTPGLF